MHSVCVCVCLQVHVSLVFAGVLSSPYRCLHECRLCVCLCVICQGQTCNGSVPGDYGGNQICPSAGAHVTSAPMNNLRFIQLIFSDALTLHRTRQARTSVAKVDQINVWKRRWLTLWDSERLDQILGDWDVSKRRSFIVLYLSCFTLLSVLRGQGPLQVGGVFPNTQVRQNQAKYCCAASHKSILASDTVTLCAPTLSRCTFSLLH